MPDFVLATEDILSEAVGLRLISELGEDFTVVLKFRKNGNAYLRQKISNFYDLSQRYPLLLITDLDQVVCPLGLITNWLPNRPKPANLLLRVAVREIESWILADHAGIMALFGSNVTKLPANPDLSDDPKRDLLRYARKAPREIRSDILPEPNTLALTGLGYNRRMSQFARDVWSPARAETRSESLRRTRKRLAALASTL